MTAGADAGPARRAGWPRWALIASLVLALACAAVYLPYPYKGDQAMFLYAARELLEGARLYADFWDMKQPGVYWFYLAGVALFGFSAPAMRLFELLWLLALVPLSIALLAPALRVRALLAAVPLFGFGMAYGAGYWGRVYNGQLELLVAVPIAACLCCLLAPVRTAGMRCALDIAAGICAGVVAVFKLLLALVPAALILLVLLWGPLRLRLRWRQAIDRALWVALGGVLLLAAAAAVFLLQGTAAEAWWANFRYPTLALENFAAAPRWRLRQSAESFISAFWPLLPLAAIGALDGLRRLSLPHLALVGWVLAAAVAVVVQLLSWWVYHFALFVVPVGLLALLGIDAIAVALRTYGGARVAVPVVLLALAAAIMPTLLWPTLQQVRDVWIGSPAPWRDLAAFQDRADPRTTAALRQGAAFLAQAEAAPGPIALLGNPAVVLVSDRRPVVAINGWTYYLPTQLEQAARALRDTRPPYAYLSSYLAHLHTNRSRALYEALDELYVPLADDGANGRWLVRRDLAESNPAR